MTSMGADFGFKCKTSSGNDLCFFGGVCQEMNETNVNQQEICICPVGFGHDFTFYHSPNCALPHLALEVFGGTFSLVWLVVLVWYVQKIWYLRKPMIVQLAAIGLVNLLSVEGVAIGIVAQSGLFEVAIVMLFISFMCLILALKMITFQLFEFANGIYADRVHAMRSALNYLTVIYTMALSISSICCLVFARSSEFWKYDLAFCILLSLSYTTLGVLCVVAAKYLNEFVGLLTATTSNGGQANEQFAVEFASMATRLKSTRNLFAMSFLNQIAFAILLVIVRSSLGSFPFAWIIIMTGLFLALGLSIGITYLFPRFQGKSSTDGLEKKRPSARHREIVSVDPKELPSATTSRESL
jgi:hypothetical protein